MAYTVAQAKDDLAGIVHGKSVSKITNINAAFRRAAQNVLAKIDPPETKIISQISFYDQVTEYACPTGLKDAKFIDLRPQTNRQASDNVSNRFSKDFDLKQWGDWLTVRNSNGLKYLGVKLQLNPGAAAIDPMDATANWAASGDASGLTTDEIYKYTGDDSLKFTLAASGATGYLANSSINSTDLSDSENVGCFFVAVYLPTATAITTLTLRIGSSATKYWEMTGALQLGSQRAGWNLFKFDWATASKTLTPDSSKITYARLAFGYGGTLAVIRAANLFMSLPIIWDMEHYAKYLFSSSGVWGENITDDNDLILLDTTGYNIFIFELGIAALQQIQGKDAKADRDHFKAELKGEGGEPGLYDLYKKNNPSQVEKISQSYYNNTGYRGGRSSAFRRI